MMKRREKIVFLFGLMLYLLVRVARIMDWPWPDFLLYQLTDFLSLPLVFILIKWLMIKSRLFPNFKELPLIAIAGLFIYWSWYFEFYLPKTDPRHTGDMLDVLMYLIGSVGYVLFLRQKPKRDLKYEI